MVLNSCTDYDLSPKLTVVLSDEDIFVTHLRERRKSAFKLLYKQYAPALYGKILNQLSDTKLANAVLEQTFIEACNDIAQYNPKKNKLFTWLNQIAKKQIHEHCLSIE